VAVTLPPLNPVERVVYDRFVDLSRRLQLPCLFDVGAAGNLSFLENLAAADQILTTSVAEGFGMVFLEAWLVDRPLIGRDLPDITRDFVARDVRFDYLRQELLLPVDWIGRDRLQKMLTGVFRQVLSDYGRPADAADRRLADGPGWLDAELIDFGRLDFHLQAGVIERVSSDRQQLRQLRQANPWVTSAVGWTGAACQGTIQDNAAAVRRGYSLPVAGPRLIRLYQAVLDSPAAAAVGTAGDASVLLETFLDLNRIYPIRLATGDLSA
jgi:hypothetical protein